MSTLAKILTLENARAIFSRLISVLICIGIVWWLSGVSIFHIQLIDAIRITPLLAAIFFRPSGRVFWFLWGLGTGGFLSMIATGGLPFK